MIENHPWLPCEWCGNVPVSCLCHPVDPVVWEAQLRRSERQRDALLARLRLERQGQAA